MWTNPDHPAPESPASPEERGQRLATLPRAQGEELRVSLDEYQGHAYVSIRVWAQGSDGNLWPVRGKGCSIRIRELADVARALMMGHDRVLGPRRPARSGLAGHAGGAGAPGPGRRALPPAELPGLEGPSVEFDEFGGRG